MERYTKQTQSATTALRRWGKPGFRKRPGGLKAVVRPFAQEMEEFAFEFAVETRTVFAEYSAFVAGFGEILSIVAPLHPLPKQIRLQLAATTTQVSTMASSLAAMRNSETEFRETMASWRRLEPVFDGAKRLALDAIDEFDVQASTALQLTRETVRTLEELLEA
jgi:hypothetical protein